MFQKILEIWGEVEGLKEVFFIFSSFPNSDTKKKKTTKEAGLANCVIKQ